MKNFNLSRTASSCWASLVAFDWFIGHASSFKENWDFVIMVAACWNVFMLPISIAFNTQDKTLETVALIIDVCFALDIIVVFRTTLLDEESGEEIKDARVIARQYLRGRFAIDFLSTVPFDQMALVSLFYNILKFCLDIHGEIKGQTVPAVRYSETDQSTPTE
jgi:hypothetical protein